MMASADVTVAEVIEVARLQQALLTPETAAYLVLAAVDQVTATPVLVDEHRCGLQIEGGKVTMISTRPASTLDAERGLRHLLGRLLEVSSGRAPALNSLAGLPDQGNLAVLASELESALIPVNRGAAARALSRLARETVRGRGALEAARSRGSASPPASETAPPPGAAADDTEPIVVGAVADGSGAGSPRESFDTLDVDADALEPELPRFALDSTGERDPSRSSFPDEPTTTRRFAIAESQANASAKSNVDELLDDCLPSTPPLGAPEPAPPVPASAWPSAHHEQEKRDSPEVATSSFPPTSARGVDELLQDFLRNTSRTQDRVAADLRRMVGVEGGALPGARADVRHADVGARGEDAPFQNAAGAADFYTSTPPPHAAASSPLALGDLHVPRASRRGLYAVLIVLSMAALGGVALFRLEPGFLSGRTQAVVEAERRAVAAAAVSAATPGAAACRATLVVSDVPTGAEVLVRSGLAPVDVERVPAGTRLEFVALHDGYAPRRGVVPQGAGWDAPSGKPRFELPIQLEKSRAKPGGLDSWPSAEPGTVVGGQGPAGTVHVVTSPRGAEVWMVAGGGPEAKLDALACGTSVDLMVAGTQQGQPLRRRLRVEASRLTPEAPANTVTIHVSAAK